MSIFSVIWFCNAFIAGLRFKNRGVLFWINFIAAVGGAVLVAIALKGK